MKLLLIEDVEMLGWLGDIRAAGAGGGSDTGEYRFACG
jgi:ribosomal protein L9